MLVISNFSLDFRKKSDTMATFIRSVRIISHIGPKCQVGARECQMVASQCIPSVLSTPSHRQPCMNLFHTSVPVTGYRNTEFEETQQKRIGKARLEAPNWSKYNDIVYPPTEKGEALRPAEICHSRFQIKYSTKKLWYLAVMIRGMSIDEAIKQLSFHKRKGAAHIKEVLEEAQEMAVRDHNVEFKSNLWVCDSFASKGITIKGVRSHGRGRFAMLHYRYSHYFVRLREGRPPKDYYPPEKTGHQKMEEYLKAQRARRIFLGL